MRTVKRNSRIACLVLLLVITGSITVTGAGSQVPPPPGRPGQTQDQTAAEKQKALERQKELERLLQEMAKTTGTPPQVPVPAPAPAAQSPTPIPSVVQQAPSSSGPIQLKFDGFSLFEFITTVADMLGITPILIDPDVKGTATIYSSAAMSREDVFPIFSSVLKNNNAALVKSGNFYKIVPISQGLREGLEIVNILPPLPPAKPPQDVQKKTEPPAGTAKPPETAGAAPPPATGGTAPPPTTAGTTPPTTAGTAKPPTTAGTTQPPATAGAVPPQISTPFGPVAAQIPPGQAIPVPQAPQPSQSRPAASTAPHLATHIIRAEYVPVTSLVEPLKMFMTEGGVIMPYERQNMLIITDYTDNVQKLLEVVHLLDNNFLDPDLVELIEIKSNVASDVLDDLKKVFGGGKDSNTGVSMVVLDRINAILLMANSKRALEEVKRWIAILDTTTGRSVQTFIYTVENGTASNIAMVLSMLFGGSDTGSGAGTQPGGGVSGGAPGGTNQRGTTGQGGTSSPYSGTSGSRSPAAGGNTMFNSAMGQQGYNPQGYGNTSNPYGYGAGIIGGQNVGGPRLSQGLGMTSQVLNGGAFSGLQGQVHLVADDMNNALIIQGSAADYNYLLDTIKRMDIMPRQAIIDARIFEIDLTDDLSFGVSATLQGRTTDNHLTTGSISADTGALSAATFAFIGSTREILMNLSALRAKTKVRVLEAPSVLALDGTPARIQVGGSVPIPGATIISSLGTPTQTVQYADTGTSLYITPRISASGTVTLQVYHDVRTPGASNGLGTTFSTTNVETTLAVKDGESVAIAGLIRESDSNARNGVPFFSDIPILGALFGRTTHSATRTELLIMITPHVIRTPDKFRDMTQDIKDSLRSVGKYADEKLNEMQNDRMKSRIENEEKLKKSNTPVPVKKEGKKKSSAPPPPVKKEEEPVAELGSRISSLPLRITSSGGLIVRA